MQVVDKLFGFPIKQETLALVAHSILLVKSEQVLISFNILHF